MVSTCNLTKQAFLYTMKDQLKIKHNSNSLNKDSRHVECSEMNMVHTIKPTLTPLYLRSPNPHPIFMDGLHLRNYQKIFSIMSLVITMFINKQEMKWQLKQQTNNITLLYGSTTVVMAIYGLHWKWRSLTPCQRHPSKPIEKIWHDWLRHRPRKSSKIWFRKNLQGLRKIYPVLF